MSSKKVTIINEGLLNSDTDSDNKDLFREEFGSWYSRSTGFKFIEKSNRDLNFESSENLPRSLDSSFYSFKQEILFTKNFSLDFSTTGLNIDFDNMEDQKESFRNRILSYVSLDREYEDFSVDMLLPISKEEKQLEPNPAIKAALLKEFDKQKPAGAYWLNGMFISLFPKEKKLYQKPGMQLIGLAASVLLIVTIAFNSNADINNSVLAQNEGVESEEETVETHSKLEIDEANEEKNLVENLEPVAQDLEKEITTLNEVAIEEKLESVENKVIAADFMYDAQPIESAESDLSIAANLDYRRNDNNLNESEESFKKGISKDKEKVATANDKLVISAITPATAEVIEEFSLEEDEVYFMDDAAVTVGAAVTGNNSIDLPMYSRTLADDTDLIGILFTAM